MVRPAKVWIAAVLLAMPAAADLAQLRDLRQAIASLKQGQVETAEARLRQLVDADPADGLSRQALGTLFLSRGRLDSARVYFEQAVEVDSLLADAHHGLAVLSSYGRDWPRAFDRYATAIRIDPGNPVYHFNAGVVYESLGRLEEAAGALDQALKIDPWNDEAHRLLASVFLQQNQPQAALKQYAVACRLAPQEARGWYGLGRAHARLGADSLAVLALERACRLDTTLQEAAYNLSLLYRRVGRVEESRRTLERARVLRARQQNMPDRVELKLADPDPARVQFRLAGLYTRLGRPSTARARLLRARRLGLDQRDAPGSLPTETMAADRIEHLAGAEMMKWFDYSQAIAHYRAAIRLTPAEASHHRGLGLALVKAERFDEAVEAYRQALRLAPDLGPALNDLAIILFKEHTDPQQAITLMERAMRSRPAEKMYIYNLAHILYSVGRHEEAAAQFEAVLALDSTSALTHYSLGATQIQLGAAAAARRHLLRALQINPEYAAAYYELAKACEGLEAWEEAEQAYRDCLRREPLHKYAHYGLGQVLARQGRTEEAQRHLARFGELPDHRRPEYIFFAPPDAE